MKLSGDSKREATSDEVLLLPCENDELKRVPREASLKYELPGM